jgi:hypothetical protein
MLFTHNKHQNQNTKLQLMLPTTNTINELNRNSNIITDKREPLHNVFQGMIFRVNSGNMYCESCNKR